MTEENEHSKAVYPMQGGLRGRDTTVSYLDIEEMRRDERIRARAEGREPNYSNLQGYGGLVTPDKLVDNVYSNPGSADIDPMARFDIVAKKDEDIPAATSVGFVDGDEKASPASVLPRDSSGKVITEDAPVAKKATPPATKKT